MISAAGRDDQPTKLLPGLKCSLIMDGFVIGARKKLFSAICTLQTNKTENNELTKTSRYMLECNKESTD